MGGNSNWIVSDDQYLSEDFNTAIVNPFCDPTQEKCVTYKIFPNGQSTKTTFELNINDEPYEERLCLLKLRVIASTQDDKIQFLHVSDIVRNIDSNVFRLISSNQAFAPNADSEFEYNENSELSLDSTDIITEIKYKKSSEKVKLSIDGTSCFTYRNGHTPINKLSCQFSVCYSYASLKVTVVEDTYDL